MTSKVIVDLGLVTSSFCQGQCRQGSIWGLGLPGPLLTTTPALPYPILLTLLFSFRMKKAGIDLPLRQFQGTLALLKCSRALLVVPPSICFPSLYLQKSGTQSQLGLASCGHSPWFWARVFFFMGV